MTSREKLYTALCIFFSVIIITGNLIYQKFVYFPILSFHVFELSAGAVLYPLTFLLTDLITEFYGKSKANFCVKLGIAMNIFVAFIITLMDKLNATAWSKVNDATFHNVFGLFSIAFIGSIVACYIAQIVDIKIYLFIRKLTNGKFLWLRNNVSTAISLFLDTFIVISIMTLFKILPSERMWLIIFNSYTYKLFFVICSTPLFYLMVAGIKLLLGLNELPLILNGEGSKT